MGTVVVWALLTGMITGGVWAGIVLIGRQRRLAAEQQALRAELERRLDALEAVDHQVADLEERLDFAERLLPTGQIPQRLPPPEP